MRTVGSTASQSTVSRPAVAVPRGLGRSGGSLKGAPLKVNTVRGRRQERASTCTVQAHIGFDVRQYEHLIDPEVGFYGTLSVLGLSAASFIATFGVIPQFKELFKEPEDWRSIYPKLVQRKTQSLEPEEAARKLSNGSVFLDVGLAAQFEKMSAEGSTNIPLYRPIQGWDFPSILRKSAFAFFGIPGTERNPTWLQEVKAAIPMDKQIVVIDEFGGTLEEKRGLEYGQQSRSLKAVYFLQNAGYKKVIHVKGGLGAWERAGLPTTVKQSGPAFSLPF